MNKSCRYIHYNNIYINFKNNQKWNCNTFIVAHMWAKKKKKRETRKEKKKKKIRKPGDWLILGDREQGEKEEIKERHRQGVSNRLETFYMLEKMRKNI